MIPEAQRIRIAIAQACGWKHVSGERWVRKEEDHVFGYSPPHYSSDLNAMHEAEKVLKGDRQKGDYVDWLHRITKASRVFAITHATAAQRAEAFLRTLGKWRD